MAKVSLLADYELYKQGETGAIRARIRGVRDASKILALPQVHRFINVAAHNNLAKSCGEKMTNLFKEARGPARGHAMRSCLRSSGVALFARGV